MGLLHKTVVRWTPQARASMERAPVFIRPLIKRRAERAARERGISEVTDALLEELKPSKHGSA